MPDTCSPDTVKEVLAIVDELAADLEGDGLKPLADQGWWSTIYIAGRTERYATSLDRCSVEAIRLLLHPENGDIDQYKVLLLFYLGWSYSRHTRQTQMSDALVGLMKATPSPIAEFGGDDLLAAFEAMLIRDRSRFAPRELLAAYDLADRTAKRLPLVLAFVRTRRSIGLQLLELPEFRANTRFAEVSDVVAADFRAERSPDAKSSPELRAEVLLNESRYEALPRPPHGEADYRRAIELIGQAMATDAAGDGTNAAYQLRMVTYEQRLNMLSALDTMSESAKSLEERLTKRQDDALDVLRRELIALLGLLAGVVGLVTSLFASTKGTPQELIIAALASSSAIAGFLLVFTVLQGGGPGYVRRCIVAAFLVVALLAAAVGIWKLF